MGSPGFPGGLGAPGPKGSQGRSGTPGSTGQDGSKGQKGPRGKKGVDGQNGPPGPNETEKLNRIRSKYAMVSREDGVKMENISLYVYTGYAACALLLITFLILLGASGFVLVYVRPRLKEIAEKQEQNKKVLHLEHQYENTIKQ